MKNLQHAKSNQLRPKKPVEIGIDDEHADDGDICTASVPPLLTDNASKSHASHIHYYLKMHVPTRWNCTLTMIEFA